MRIVLFNWRDRKHPRAGGAEFYTHHALSALASRGHECVWFASAAEGLEPLEHTDQYTIVRAGNELTCRFEAYRWLARRRGEFDRVIDEVNTLPWLSPLVAKDKTMLLIHQLAREVWWAEAPLPFAAVGYAMEPAYLRLYRNSDVVTISASSAESLRDVGLRGRIQIVECPLEQPFADTANPISGLVGYVGRVTPSKRIADIIRAVAFARRLDSKVRLLVIGSGAPREMAALRALCKQLGVTDAVEFAGRVSDAERDRRLREVDVLALASLREGWGLVVSEAARWRIPSVAYAVPGLRDSIVHERTGLLTEQTPDALGSAILQVVGDREKRNAFGAVAAERLAEFSPSRFAERFCAAVESCG